MERGATGVADMTERRPRWRIECEEQLTGFAREVYDRLAEFTDAEADILFYALHHELGDRVELREAPRRKAQEEARAEQRRVEAEYQRQWRRTRRKVLARDRYTCQYCGAVEESMHVDHKVARSQGGTDDLDNLVTACGSCNSSKGDRSLETWRRSGQATA